MAPLVRRSWSVRGQTITSRGMGCARNRDRFVGSRPVQTRTSKPSTAVAAPLKKAMMHPDACTAPLADGCLDQHILAESARRREAAPYIYDREPDDAKSLDELGLGIPHSLECASRAGIEECEVAK